MSLLSRTTPPSPTCREPAILATAAAMKLPEYCQSDPASWFQLVEAVFPLHTDDARYYLVVAALEQQLCTGQCRCCTALLGGRSNRLRSCFKESGEDPHLVGPGGQFSHGLNGQHVLASQLGLRRFSFRTNCFAAASPACVQGFGLLSLSGDLTEDWVRKRTESCWLLGFSAACDIWGPAAGDRGGSSVCVCSCCGCTP